MTNPATSPSYICFDGIDC